MGHTAVSRAPQRQDRHFGVQGGLGREVRGRPGLAVGRGESQSQEAQLGREGERREGERREGERRERRGGEERGGERRSPCSPACEDPSRLEAGAQPIGAAQSSPPGSRGGGPLEVTGEKRDSLQGKHGPEFGGPWRVGGRPQGTAHQRRTRASSKPMGWMGIGGNPEAVAGSRRKEEGLAGR